MIGINKNEKKKDYKFFYVFALLVGLSVLLYAVKFGEERNFENNKSFVDGIITEVVFDTYSAEFISYERYLLEYEYLVENENLLKKIELRKTELPDYFDEVPKTGDSITVAYNSLNPLDSKPVKNEN